MYISPYSLLDVISIYVDYLILCLLFIVFIFLVLF